MPRRGVPRRLFRVEDFQRLAGAVLVDDYASTRSSPPLVPCRRFPAIGGSSTCRRKLRRSALRRYSPRTPSSFARVGATTIEEDERRRRLLTNRFPLRRPSPRSRTSGGLGTNRRERRRRSSLWRRNNKEDDNEHGDHA